MANLNNKEDLVLLNPTGTLSSEISAELPPSQIKDKRENTRGILAVTFIIGFFVMMILGISIVIMDGSPLSEKTDNLQNVLLAISGVLSGPLGFVVGYYFRKTEETEGA